MVAEGVGGRSGQRQNSLEGQGRASTLDKLGRANVFVLFRHRGNGNYEYVGSQ